MNPNVKQGVVIAFTFATAIFAQPGQQRQASLIGGGDPSRGKCTVEVVVDGVAQVEVRGNTASLRTLSGQPAQWRRFECTAAMPANPPNFRFAGVDGRGRQSLVRDPRNGGAAVVQIEDRDGGSEGYTFDLFWDSRGPGSYPTSANRDRGPGGSDRGPDPGQYRPDSRDSEYSRRTGRSFTVDEAVRVCQQSIASQAENRWHREIHFHRTAIDDNPGRQDWVTGTLDVHRGPREERFAFSCSVNFDTGRVRTADLDPRPLSLNDPRWRQ